MPFKILSLDGGATWALVQARVLKDIYEGNGGITGHELLKKFDLVIANSGGSVLLSLLCSNMSLDEIIAFYKETSKLEKIFPKFLWWQKLPIKLFRWLTGAGPKYDTEKKLSGLFEAIGHNKSFPSKHVLDIYLDELPAAIGKNYQGKHLRLVIAGFDYFTERVTFFRSDPDSKAGLFSGNFYRITLGNAIHASTNAPVNYYDKPAIVNFNFFPKHDVNKYKNKKGFFWDGAVAGFNNPVLAGLVEAVTNNDSGNPAEQIYILSLGTGQKQKALISDYPNADNSAAAKRIFEINNGKPFITIATPSSSSRLFKDIQKLSKSILSDPPDSDTFISYCFLHPGLDEKNARIVRINPFITPSFKDDVYDYPAVYKDQPDNFLKLMKLDFDIYTPADIELVNTMCDKFIVSDGNKPCLQNQLIRGDITEGKFLGFKTYRQAKERWLEIEDLLKP